MHDNEDVYSKYLGKKSDYIDTYTPSLLEPIPRVLGREKIGLMDDTLPFDGFDLWTAFELSWLNQKGKPMVGMAEFKVPAQSKKLIESKSLKLYLNSLNQSHFDSSKSLQSVLSKDLSNAAVGAVSVTVSEGMKNDDLHIHHPKAVNIDDIDIEVHDYRFNEGYLKDATHETVPFVSETLMSHLLKSNCLVTHQPDWGSVFIKYEGNKIDREKLLRYIISFRQHHEFHEQCVERIFLDIKKYCRPEKLTVFARYTQGKNPQPLPALFFFPQILQHRLHAINKAFKSARDSFGYQGDYCLVYPIKVNQHRRVIESLLKSGESLGLEAGSKAEMVAVLAYAGGTRSLIVCNGYKDREYIRLALMGEKLGYKVYLVIEKMSEIKMVLEEAKRLNVVPRLGVRARLASEGSGKWQASGGEKSKFGLSATQVLQLVEILKSADCLSGLQLLHFHLGSQLSNIHDIATGVRESARFYVELHKLGVKISCFDVGGGLGVDYEGTRSQSDCSVNYGLKEYANNVIWGIGEICNENHLPHPTVISESSRALTAHHTVLISNVIGVERNEFSPPQAPEKHSPRALESLWYTWQEMQKPDHRHSLRECLHDSQRDLQDVHTQYTHGILDLKQRAWAEQLYLQICHHIQKELDPSDRAHRTMIDNLQERMADKLYVNFSLFQSLPDAWGINQLFPILPLEGLNQRPERRAVLLDITCDSDGIIEHYVDGDGVANTLPIPPYDAENPPILGFFMVGAYQEILGNMHNLFGDTAVVEVSLDEQEKISVKIDNPGNTVSDMLKYVKLDPKALLAYFAQKIKKTDLNAQLQMAFLEEFEASLYGYTYLEHD